MDAGDEDDFGMFLVVVAILGIFGISVAAVYAVAKIVLSW